MISAHELRQRLAAKRNRLKPSQPTLVISMVGSATDTRTRDVSVEKVFEAIRTGGAKLKGQITQIRNRFEAELAITGDRKKAKLAVDPLKKQLPGVMWSGRFSQRANSKLEKRSDKLCVDLDSLGDKLPEVRKKLEASPNVVAVFLSPTGDGLKVVFRVSADPSAHGSNFCAAQNHVRELTGCEIDESCKDPARLCFMSYDQELYVNEEAVEITALPEPVKPKITPNAEINLSERQRITVEFLGDIDWQSEASGYVQCPGKHLYTTGDNDRDCKIDFDHVPTLHCFHDHCRGILDAINRELRSRIGKAEYVRPETPHVEVQEAHEPPPPPPPYVPPPLTLLPSQVQEYVIAAADSLNVDVAYILLPLLSSLGAAIGNSRSIKLKPGFVQPPVIWTGIIGRSGSRKSPALDKGCFAVMEHERGLMRKNKQEKEIYENDLAEWEAKDKKKRGKKPKPPGLLTSLMDDMSCRHLQDAVNSIELGRVAQAFDGRPTVGDGVAEAVNDSVINRFVE